VSSKLGSCLVSLLSNWSLLRLLIVQGCAYLISRYYKRQDFSVRYAFFFSAAVLAGAFGGVRNTPRVDSDITNNHSSWHMPLNTWIKLAATLAGDGKAKHADLALKKLTVIRIFIIEGLATFVCVGIGLLCIPRYPEESTFLKPEEKQYLLAMLEKDAGPSRPNHYNYLVMKECLLDPKIWLGYISVPISHYQSLTYA
jgi:hypothetical protein